MISSNSWNYKEIDKFYDRVRALLDNSSEASIPDEYIDLPEKAPFAEMYAKSKVKRWNELEAPNFKLFESAIIYKTASMFESFLSSKSIKKKELPTLSLEYFQKSTIQIEGMSLSELADKLLNQIVGREDFEFLAFEVT